MTDVEDVHHYHGSGPECYPGNRDYVARITARDKPLFISEWLGLTYLPDLDKLKRRHEGEVPWWFYLPYVEGVLPLEGTWPRAREVTFLDYEEKFYEWDWTRYSVALMAWPGR